MLKIVYLIVMGGRIQEEGAGVRTPHPWDDRVPPPPPPHPPLRWHLRIRFQNLFTSPVSHTIPFFPKKNDRSAPAMYYCNSILRRRPHVSRYFWIRNVFFPDTASVYALPDIFESATFSFWIRLPSTRVRIFLNLKNFSVYTLSDSLRIYHFPPFGADSKISGFAECVWT